MWKLDLHYDLHVTVMRLAKEKAVQKQWENTQSVDNLYLIYYSTIKIPLDNTMACRYAIKSLGIP